MTMSIPGLDQMNLSALLNLLECAFNVHFSSGCSQFYTRTAIRHHMSLVEATAPYELVETGLGSVGGHELDIACAKICGIGRRYNEPDHDFAVRALRRYQALLEEPVSLRITPGFIKNLYACWSDEQIDDYFDGRDHVLLWDALHEVGTQDLMWLFPNLMPPINVDADYFYKVVARWVRIRQLFRPGQLPPKRHLLAALRSLFSRISHYGDAAEDGCWMIYKLLVRAAKRREKS